MKCFSRSIKLENAMRVIEFAPENGVLELAEKPQLPAGSNDFRGQWAMFM